MGARQDDRLLAFARDELLARVVRARTSVELASPYLTVGVARALADQARAGVAERLRLLTALTAPNVAGGALDPDALRTLIEAGFEVRSIPNLHAKVSIVDRRWTLVGSGNLTDAGLGGSGRGGNVELGVVVDAAAASRAARLFDEWWKVGAPVGERQLGPFDALARAAGGTSGLPAPVGRALRLPAPPVTRRRGATRWVKAMNHDRRADRGAWWLERPWLHDRHLLRDERPVRRPGYRPGDVVVLYLVEPRRCPAAFVVQAKARFAPETVAAVEPQDAERYGWVTDVELLAARPLEDAPALDAFGVHAPSLQNRFARSRSVESFDRAVRRLAHR